MKVVFTGLSYFASTLVSDLNQFDHKNHYVFLDTYASKLDQFKFIFQALNADLVVSFNGVTSKSKALDYAIKLKKKVVLQWQGSDVLNVNKNKEQNVYTSKYLSYSTHFTDATWLQDELKKHEIVTKILHFKHLEAVNQDVSFSGMEALTYLGQGKENFYGFQSVLKLAKAHPDINFNVIGSTGKGLELCENIKFLGWVDQLSVKSLLDSCPIYIRLTAHDGYALSVLEAIANGNYVFWNHPHPQCIVTKTKDDLLDQFEMLKGKVIENNFVRLQDNIEWAKRNLNKSVILTNYIRTLEQIAS